MTAAYVMLKYIFLNSKDMFKAEQNLPASVGIEFHRTGKLLMQIYLAVSLISLKF